MTRMTTPPDPQALLRSKSYLSLLCLAALLGVPISAAAYGFLELVSYLQRELFTRLPYGLGFHGEPPWWPLPIGKWAGGGRDRRRVSGFGFLSCQLALQAAAGPAESS
jgi:hypothetical protein